MEASASPAQPYECVSWNGSEGLKNPRIVALRGYSGFNALLMRRWIAFFGLSAS